MGANDKVAATFHPNEYACEECSTIWNTTSAAEACEIRDIEDAKIARINPPRRDPNIIRSNN